MLHTHECSGLLLVGPPEPLLHLGGQGVEQVLLHHQATALEQWAFAQLHRQALQSVATQLDLGQAGQLAHPRGQRLQHVVAQVQGPQLPALEELGGQCLNLEVRRKGHSEVGAAGTWASGPPASLPQVLAPSLMPISATLDLRDQHKLGLSLANSPVFCRSWLCRHFLQEAFLDLLVT